jgi:hypothetical protein
MNSLILPAVVLNGKLRIVQLRASFWQKTIAHGDLRVRNLVLNLHLFYFLCRRHHLSKKW